MAGLRGSVKTAISIITCPRPGGASYIARTAAALLEAGADECDRRFVFADGDHPPDDLPGWEIDVKYPRGGTRAMMWWAFERAVETGADRLIYCEDDIEPVRNAVRYIRRLAIPLWAAFVDFHDFLLPEGPVRDTRGALVGRAADRGYVGNLCMLFPRRTLLWLVQQDPFSVLPEQQRDGLHFASDHALGELVGRSIVRSYAVHVPRLVRHAGEVSAAHPQRSAASAARMPRAVPPPDFDALSLVAT